jgi:hypothetical protein
MKSLDEIAREAATKLVTIHLDTSGRLLSVLIDGKMLPQYHNDLDAAEGHAVEVRDALTAAVLAALKEAMAPQVEGPVSGERLEQAEIYCAKAKAEDRGWIFVPHMEAQKSALDHLARLNRFLMGSPEGDDLRILLAQAERRGFARGAEAQHDVSFRAAHAATAGLADGAVRYGGQTVRKAVRDAPLATPDGEG